MCPYLGTLRITAAAKPQNQLTLCKQSARRTESWSSNFSLSSLGFKHKEQCHLAIDPSQKVELEKYNQNRGGETVSSSLMLADMDYSPKHKAFCYYVLYMEYLYI